MEGLLSTGPTPSSFRLKAQITKRHTMLDKFSATKYFQTHYLQHTSLKRYIRIQERHQLNKHMILWISRIFMDSWHRSSRTIKKNLCLLNNFYILGAVHK